MSRKTKENATGTVTKKKRCRKFLWLLTGIAAVAGIKKTMDNSAKVEEDLVNMEESEAHKALSDC